MMREGTNNGTCAVLEEHPDTPHQSTSLVEEPGVIDGAQLIQRFARRFEAILRQDGLDTANARLKKSQLLRKLDKETRAEIYRLCQSIREHCCI